MGKFDDLMIKVTQVRDVCAEGTAEARSGLEQTK
jgi:hypothetical protein